LLRKATKLRGFRGNRSLRRFIPAVRTGDPFLFLRTGAEASAYSRSASPRRRRFYPRRVCVPVVSVLKR